MGPMCNLGAYGVARKRKKGVNMGRERSGQRKEARNYVWSRCGEREGTRPVLKEMVASESPP